MIKNWIHRVRSESVEQRTLREPYTLVYIWQHSYQTPAKSCRSMSPRTALHIPELQSQWENPQRLEDCSCHLVIQERQQTRPKKLYVLSNHVVNYRGVYWIWMVYWWYARMRIIHQGLWLGEISVILIISLNIFYSRNVTKQSNTYEYMSERRKGLERKQCL